MTTSRRNSTDFTYVLFAWSAMGAAFGPLLLVTVLRGPVSPPRILGSMTAGFTLSVASFSFPDTQSGPERVVPWIAALAIAAWPSPGPGAVSLPRKPVVNVDASTPPVGAP